MQQAGPVQQEDQGLGLRDVAMGQSPVWGWWRGDSWRGMICFNFCPPFLQPTYSDLGDWDNTPREDRRRNSTPSSLSENGLSRWYFSLHLLQPFLGTCWQVLTPPVDFYVRLVRVCVGSLLVPQLCESPDVCGGCLYPDLLPSYTMSIILISLRAPLQTHNHFSKVNVNREEILWSNRFLNFDDF